MDIIQEVWQTCWRGYIARGMTCWLRYNARGMTCWLRYNARGMTCWLGFKGTQDWEFFWLRFWNLHYFFVSYAKILRFYKKKFWLAHYWGGTSGFWPQVRARALRASVFLGSLPRPSGRCAPPPSQLRCFTKIKKIDYFQIKNASLQARTRVARGDLSTGPPRL